MTWLVSRVAVWAVTALAVAGQVDKFAVALVRWGQW